MRERYFIIWVMNKDRWEYVGEGWDLYKVPAMASLTHDNAVVYFRTWTQQEDWRDNYYPAASDASSVVVSTSVGA